MISNKGAAAVVFCVLVIWLSSYTPFASAGGVFACVFAVGISLLEILFWAPEAVFAPPLKKCPRCGRDF